MQRTLMVLAMITLPRAATLAAQATADGKAVYAKHCQACHGAAGVPPAALAKQMSIPAFDAVFAASRSDDSVVSVIRNGGKKMKGFGGKLSPDEMKAVASYVRLLANARK